MCPSTGGIADNDANRLGIPLKHGSRLRYDLHDDCGKLLLPQGAEITERVQSLLQHRGITLNILANLKVTSGSCRNGQIPVTKRITIGRQSTCNVQLASEVVSGVHCAIEKRSIGLWLENLKSTNGTFL